MEGADCTRETEGSCPSWFDTSCCLPSGQCGTLDCGQDWLMYMLWRYVPLLAFGSLLICCICVLNPWAGEADHFAPGVIVLLHGLERNPHYNNSIGVIERYDADTGVWSVKMRTGGICAVRRENLALVEMAAGTELASR